MPRRPVRWLTDPGQWHALTAFTWLLIAAVLRAGSALADLGLALPTLPADAGRHALGAGFVTLLIYGIGGHLLPGFVGRPPAAGRLTWATLIVGNLAAGLRVGPLIWPGGPGFLLPLAGLAGTAALAIFAVNLRRATRRPAKPGPRPGLAGQPLVQTPAD